MNIIKLANEILPDFKKIEVGHVQDDKSNYIAYEAVCLNSNGNIFGGGFKGNREEAIKVAISESLERYYFHRLKESKSNDCLINEYPTTCGFAFGFDRENTKNRSILEAVERMCWTTWIEKKYAMEEYEFNPKSNFENYIFDKFDKIRMFRKIIKVKHNEFSYSIQVLISLCYLNGGVFPGSVASFIKNGEANLFHALSESLRHYLAFKKSINKTGLDLSLRRLIYYSKKSKFVDEKIKDLKKTDWPDFKIKIIKEVRLEKKNVFLYRSLCEDHISWHLGGEERFAI